MRVPNLARDPFLNRRPVRRLAALLWIVGAVLLATDAWLYWRHFSGRGEERSELAELEEAMTQERWLLDKALADLQWFDLAWQRDQIGFLNARIAERTFAWSSLFDHLAEALPPSVRIERVTPRLAGARSRRRQTVRAPGDEVTLEITGAAEVDDALLALVDAFFAHERFRRPNLQVESRDPKSKQVGFSMTVVYRPEPRGQDERQGGEEPRESPAPAAAAEAEVQS